MRKKRDGGGDLLPQQRDDRRSRKVIFLALVCLLILAFFCAALGRFMVPPEQALRILLSYITPEEVTWTEQMETVLIGIRLPRIIAAILVGAALSVSGAAYQSIFRNVLVSPDILGVSSGACIGAALAILMHVNSSTEIFAFAGALLTVFITTMIPRLLKNRSPLMLVLSGILIGGLMTSVMSCIKYVADPEEELQEIVYWTMGSLAGIGWGHLAVIAPIIILCLAGMIFFRWRLDIMAMGDGQAKSLGMNIRRMRAVYICLSTLLTSSAVCISGTIGWIGLVIPHICRLIVGQSNKNIIPMSIVSGGMFLLIVDTVCRTISPNEIPLSIFTGIIGVPLFIWLLVV